MSDSMQDKFHDLLFGVRRSIRYHNRRRSFFDRFHKTNTVLGLIGGSAVVVSLLAEWPPSFPLVFSALIAISAAIDLVINSAGSARFHHDLSRKYFSLEKEMIASEQELNHDLLSAWTQARLDIEAEEPPVLHVLNTICHNELCRALGYDESNMVHIGWSQRLLCHIKDLGEHKIKARTAC